MPLELSKRDKKLLDLAKRGGDDSQLLILDNINELEDKFDAKTQEIETKFDTTVEEIKQSIPNLDTVLESVRGKQGIQGEVGPQGEKGERGEVGPEGPQGIQGIKGERGETGPKGIDGLDGLPGVDGKDGATGPAGSPDTADDIRDKLEAGFVEAPENEKIDRRVIKGLDRDIKELKARPQGGGGMSQMALQFAMSKLIKHQEFATSSATTTVTLSNKVAGNVCAWVRYNGQMLRYTTDYTISGTTITFTFTLADSTTVEVTYFAS